ncbi:MAG: proline hydroxylase, partial [Rhodospirillales bacterium]|nr:proline hydroxylase [Rhodospirillales bacterium]
MRLSQAQLEEFDREGYLFLPGVFTAEEVAILNRETPGIFAQDRQEVTREKGSTAPRT